MMNNDVILLVEDNPDDIALALRALKKNNLGKQVIVARDGAEALQYLFGQGQVDASSNPLPELIMLDLKLPKVNGLEVLKQLRSNDRTRHLPVVIMTTSNERQDIINCYDSGANSYIRKPVDFAKFYEVIKQISTYWLGLNEGMPHRRLA